MNAPARIHGFAPILGEAPRVLILGSMPSERSLAENQYYGHPRNRFWPVMGELFVAGPELAYAARCDILADAGLAVWDVLASCRRPGSLDAAIERASEEVNPIAELLADTPSIRVVLFNGQTAAKTFGRHIGRTELEHHTLPSTSPANAAWGLERLVEVWGAALDASARLP